KLAPGGIIVFHVSNRYLELASVVAEVAATHRLTAYRKYDASLSPDDFSRTMRASSLVVAVARREDDLAALGKSSGWKKYHPEQSVRPWTDDYSNIVSAFWRMQGIRAQAAVVP